MVENYMEENLNLKKRICIWALLLIIKIVEPNKYAHEYQKELDEMKSLLLQSSAPSSEVSGNKE